MSGRDCSYASQTVPPETPPTPGTLSHERSISPGGSRSRGGGSAQPGATPLTTASRSNPDSPEPGLCHCAHQDPTSNEATINLNHMELVAHLTTNGDMFNLTDNVDNRPYAISFALKTGVESPFLLYQLLAFSARHLAFLHPDRSAFYLHQAVTLQTRAVSLFNATSWTERVDQSNCVPVLLFSSILGHHLLADTLDKRDGEGLEDFMIRFVQCMEMHRGVYTIAKDAWPLLMETELEPVLSQSIGFTSREPKGNHCRQISEIVDGAAGLSEEEKEACRLAIKYLQVGLDAALEEGGGGYRYQMLFSWTMLAPPELTGLLAAKRPEVLVLLGYYALLLHYGREMWQVGNAGAYILGMVVDYLSPEWHHWLEYPRGIIARDLVQH